MAFCGSKLLLRQAHHLNRANSGSILIASVAFTVFLFLIIVAALGFSFQIHKSQLCRNAVDRCTLNIAARLPEVGVEPVGCFYDCANSQGVINMACLNRVQGKALLINLNAESMAAIGAAGNSIASANAAYEDAVQIAQNLRREITDKDRIADLYGAMEGVAPRRPLNLNLGAEARLLNAADPGCAPPSSDFNFDLQRKNIELQQQGMIGTSQSGKDRERGLEWINQAMAKDEATYKPVRINPPKIAGPNEDNDFGNAMHKLQTSVTAQISQASPSKKGPGLTVRKKRNDSTEFDFAFEHAGEGSNIVFSPSQLPPKTSLEVAGNNIPGYTTVTANGVDFGFIPFKPGELSHLISTEEFAKHRRYSGRNSEFAIPNAVQAKGSAGPDDQMKAVASAIVNPRHEYPMTIPHGFVRMVFPPVKLTWMLNKKKKTESEYSWWDFGRTATEIKNEDFGCDVINCSVNLASEYKINNGLITCLAQNETKEKIYFNVLQRLREVDPNLTLKKLIAISNVKPVRGEHSYIFYPQYHTNDCTEPDIRCVAAKQMQSAWLDPNAPPDGRPIVIGQEMFICPADSTSIKRSTKKWKIRKSQLSINGDVIWIPGTGYNGCLGTMVFARRATAEFEGECGGKDQPGCVGCN